jgi:hypothetical protein
VYRFFSFILSLLRTVDRGFDNELKSYEPFAR